MTFHNPEFLFFLLLLIPMIGIYLWELHKSEASLQVSSHQHMKKYSNTFKVRARHLLFVLRIFSVAALILALARPLKTDSWKTKNTEGIDIMMTMDISGTMYILNDFLPNRLEAAKEIGIDFVKSRPNDNIGLVLFAGKSFTQCPLTTDHNALINLFNSVKYGMIEDGTAIGEGLATSVTRIKDGPSESKIIILITDGVNNRGEISPKMAGEIAKVFGVKVYIIGVGSHKEIKIPYNTPLGVRYEIVKDVFDEEPLKEIAQMTGGTYFRATDNESFRKTYDEIDKMEKTIISEKEFNKKEESYYIFALLALILLTAEIVLRNTIFKPNP